MANVKISDLPVATSVTGPDSFPVVQGGVTKQATRSVLFASPTFTGTTTTDILTAAGNVTFDGGAFVFNESGADKDARFEGDGDPNLLFLDASTDRVGIGTNAPTAKLDVVGEIVAGGAGGALKQVDTTDDVAIQIYSDTANEGIIDCFQNSNPATKRTLFLQKYGGNVLIGLGNLDVNGSIRAKQGVPDAADSSTTGYAFGVDGDTGMFSPVVGGGAGNGVLAFYCNNTERLRMIATNASLISTVDSTAPTLSTNSTMSFELTSNTSLKIVVRGTDGTTRSVSLTLS